MLTLTFDSGIIVWRGPSPFYFLPIPQAESDRIAAVAEQVSYGWGVIPVEATIGDVRFTTSLFPRDGAYLLPVKAAVRKQLAAIDLERVSVTMRVGGPAKA